ncbi:unnamed protein product [Rhizophagus irregularis]|nr:unnamed protein product [Rhizophagus irregularis]
MRRTPSQASLPPAPPYYPRQSKADQIVQNFYTKVAQIITQARLIQYDSLSSGNIPLNTNLTLNPRQASKRPNKWFNLEIWDSDDVYKEDLKDWRHTATSTGLPPDPMTIEFFLDTSELPKNKILVITDEIRRRKVDVHDSNEDGKTKNILLESWQLTLSHPSTDPPPDLPVVYKKSIAFFHDIGIDVPIIEGETNVSSQFTFGPIDTPLGSLSLKAKYRTNCEFYIDESEEEMISANFMVDFDEQFFTPTVVKYYQEQEQRKQKEERRKSVPTRMNTPPSGYLFPHSPQYNNPLLSGTPQSNPDVNTELSFPKIQAPNITAPILPLRSYDSRRSLENQRSGRYDNLSSSRPNVTLVQPFKSPSLSSSPSQDNLPSPTFSERSSPLHRSPSSLSLQQRSSRPSDGSGGSFNSSFFASLDPDDDGISYPSSIYKSKQLQQLSRFQKSKESHNSLSDSITSITLQSGPQQLEPQSGLTHGTLSGSVSSSSTLSSIRTEMGMIPTDNIIIRDYSSYPNELGVGIRHVDSSSSLSSQHLITDGVGDITGSPASGNSIQDELLFNLEVPVNSSVGDGDVNNVINNTIGTTTENNQKWHVLMKN